VSLQIQNLCDSQRMIHENDIYEELGKLPNTLKESYDIIYERVKMASPTSQQIAERAIKWLLCAQRPLNSPEFIAAISVDSNGNYTPLTIPQLLNMCCNLVVLDEELDIFRFAHLSLREYLEGREEYSQVQTHTLAIERCIETYTPREEPRLSSVIELNDIFRRYATLYWPVHCQNIGSELLGIRAKDKVKQFLFHGYNAAPSFIEWTLAATDLSQSLEQDDPLRHTLAATVSSPPTPLFLACCFGLLWIVNELGTFGGFNWDQLNANGDRGLNLAARWGHEAIVMLLLDKVSLDSKDRSGRTPLLWAAITGHMGVVKLLLGQDVDVDLMDSEFGQTPLSWAAQNGHEAVIQLLLDKDADVESKDRSGRTPLSWAAWNGHEAVVKLLIKKDVRVNSKDRNDRTPLLWAAIKGHDAVVKLLLEQGVAVDSKDTEYSRTPLSWAARNGHEAVVKLLLENYADVNSKDKYNRTALSWAAIQGHDVVAKLLLEKSVDVDWKDGEFGLTPLLWAARNGHEALVKLLLGRGVDVDSKDRDGQTPLSWAARNGYESVVQLLVEKGATLDSEDNSSRTPLSWAAQNGHEVVVQFLLEEGAVIDCKCDKERTALSYAASGNHVAVVRLLLDEGAEGTEIDTLHHAVITGEEDIVGLLLDQGADIDARAPGFAIDPGDSSKWTPLQSAAARGHVELVWLLLKKGANVAARDAKERTAKCLASEYKFEDKLKELFLDRPLVEGPVIASKPSLSTPHDLELPKPPLSSYRRDSCHSFQTAIVDFFVKDRDYHVVEKCSVHEVLYGQGPDAIMDAIGKRDKRSFRWHHLPANNVSVSSAE
jgi:ankyrin repeat protein